LAVIFDAKTAPPTLRLAGAVDINEAAELKAALLEALASGASAEIVLQDLTGADVSTLQLLHAGENAARARGCAWKRTGAIPAVLRAVAEEAAWPGLPFAGEGE